MKGIISGMFTLFLYGVIMSQTPVSLNMNLVSHWDNNDLPVSSNLVYNEVWGWADGAGREYAILGSLGFTFFIDVTDPANPVVADSVAGGYNLCIHRDFKTYQHYAYGVADEGTNSTLQIFDLQFLPDSVQKVYDSNAFFRRAHNIFIDEDSGLLYAVGTNTQNLGVIILDLEPNPANPTLVASHNLSSYTHDVYVRNDTAWMSNGNSGLFVYDFSTPTVPVLIGSLDAYPDQGYNHSSWLNPAGTHLVMADETRGKRLKVLDVTSLPDLSVTSLFESTLMAPAHTNSIPHNPFFLGDTCVISYYHDGIQVFDLSDPANPVRVSYYDTDNVATSYSGWYGAWGAYPYLPSGLILGSDVLHGLFVLEMTSPILEVSLTEFTAEARSGGFTRLNWNTEAENNFSHFIIQRSADGSVYTDLYKLPGSGTPSSYLYDDESPARGINFYRLKQVDQDGKISYSEIRYVFHYLSNQAIKLFPNPIVNRGEMH
jgi:choice-of-anchor B domain-containing protein